MRTRHAFPTVLIVVLLLALTVEPAFAQLRAATRALNAPTRLARQGAATVISQANPSAVVDLAMEGKNFVVDLVDLSGSASPVTGV